MEEPGRGDDEHHLGGLFDRVPEDLGKIPDREGFEDEEPQDRHIERRDGGRFGRGEEAREHAADHDHRRKKREEGFAEGVPAFAPTRAGRHGVAAAPRNVGGPEHEEDPEENARNRARCEKGVHARLGEACIENERDARRDDRTEGAARCDRRAAEGALVARLRHFRDGDHADPGRAGSCGPRHGGHDDAGDDGGVGETARAVADADAPEAEEALGDAAHRHEISHEEEEGNRHERNPRDLRVHALRHEEEPCRVTARPEIGGDRYAAHRDGRRDADHHQHEHGGEDHKHDHDGNPQKRLSKKKDAFVLGGRKHPWGRRAQSVTLRCARRRWPSRASPFLPCRRARPPCRRRAA